MVLLINPFLPTEEVYCVFGPGKYTRATEHTCVLWVCIMSVVRSNLILLQGGWGGWPTGNGKKLSSCQAQLGQATCLAVA